MKRVCGNCQLCCQLLPVEELDKPALKRCRHQKHAKGCSIYAERPLSCAIWNCRWLVDEATIDLRRPDHSHYVVDIMPDLIQITTPGGQPQEVEVIVVWLDPAQPLAYRDPALLRFVDRERKPAMVRIGSADAFVMFPPSMTGEGWVESDSQMATKDFKGLAERMREARAAG